MNTRRTQYLRPAVWAAASVAVGLVIGFSAGTWTVRTAVAEQQPPAPLAVTDTAYADLPDGVRESLDGYAAAIRSQDAAAASRFVCGDGLPPDLAQWPLLGGRSLVDVRHTRFAEVSLTAGAFSREQGGDRATARVYGEFLVDPAADGRGYVQESVQGFVLEDDRWLLCPASAPVSAVP